MEVIGTATQGGGAGGMGEAAMDSTTRSVLACSYSKANVEGQ